MYARKGETSGKQEIQSSVKIVLDGSGRGRW